MIQSLVSGGCADKYCYDTGLTFGDDFGRHILSLAVVLKKVEVAPESQAG